MTHNLTLEEDFVGDELVTARCLCGWKEAFKDQQSAVKGYAAHKKESERCKHEHLNMDGICHNCGEDRRRG